MKPSPASERSLRLAPDGVSVLILDQTLLPHGVKTVRLRTLEQAAHAIRTMQVRGSNLIGVTAAYGMALALRADASNSGLEAAYSVLIETRPTAVNLRWALDLMRDFLRPMPASRRVDAAYAKAAELLEEDVATNRSIGDHGLALFRELLAKRPKVDVVIVGADRVTAAGDVANKIGTYLKALAAREHKIPFYVAFVGGSVDWNLRDGVREIPIEQRSAREVTHITGVNSAGKRVEVRLTPEGTPARNDGFDVTPAKLITGLITERGVCRASVAGLARLYGRLDRADRGSGRSVRATRR